MKPAVDSGECAKILKALGDESRLRIVRLLLQGEKCVGEIVDSLDMIQPQASDRAAPGWSAPAGMATRSSILLRPVNFSPKKRKPASTWAAAPSISPLPTGARFKLRFPSPCMAALGPFFFLRSIPVGPFFPDADLEEMAHEGARHPQRIERDLHRRRAQMKICHSKGVEAGFAE